MKVIEVCDLKGKAACVADRLGLRLWASDSGNAVVLIDDTPEARRVLRNAGLLKYCPISAGQLFLSGVSRIRKFCEIR